MPRFLFTYADFFPSSQWTTSITQTTGLSLPFGLVPGGETVTMLVKKVAALNCIIFVGIFQLLFGYWKPGKDPLSSSLKSK